MDKTNLLYTGKIRLVWGLRTWNNLFSSITPTRSFIVIIVIFVEICIIRTNTIIFQFEIDVEYLTLIFNASDKFTIVLVKSFEMIQWTNFRRRLAIFGASGQPHAIRSNKVWSNIAHCHWRDFTFISRN